MTLSSAMARFGRKGALVDNAKHPPVFFTSVDLRTGALGAYARQKPHNGAGKFERHADSNEPFIGAFVPQWREVLEMLLQAARSFAPLASIAWDIAITEQGPVIIKGDANWDISTAQMFAGLGDTELGWVSMQMWRENRSGVLSGAREVEPGFQSSKFGFVSD